MDIPDVFRTTHTVAVIGLSDNPQRYSYQVARYLQSRGFRIIPVNPNVREVLGEKAYPDLTSIPENVRIDAIDLFRKSSEVLPHVQEAVERGDVRTVWMQEGIENETAKRFAETHGLTVVMNMCMMKARAAL